MTAVKVKSEYGEGLVEVENWANPKTYLVDVSLENGDTMPVEKENLEYVCVEKF